MARISDDFLECVFYLYASRSDAEQGVSFGGTGFLVSITSRVHPQTWYVYAVTNRHVIEGGATVIRFNTHTGSNDVLELTQAHWFVDPRGNDLAVYNLAPSLGHHKIKAVNTTDFITRSILNQYSIGPGDDAFMVGRFINHEGIQRNLPAVRFGNIAMMPDEPVYHPSNANRQQESFLVEVRSTGGYSGSPVFAHIPSFSKRPGSADLGSLSYGPWLLGIDWANLSGVELVRNENGRELDGASKGWYVNANTGMAAVIPAWILRELLDTNELALPREANEEMLTNQGR